jgi:hypothetical protein
MWRALCLDASFTPAESSSPTGLLPCQTTLCMRARMRVAQRPRPAGGANPRAPSARRAAFRDEAIEPKARLKTLRGDVRPSEAALAPLSAERDALPEGRRVHALTLTYKLDVKEAGKHTVRLPLLNRRAAP